MTGWAFAMAHMRVEGGEQLRRLARQIRDLEDRREFHKRLRRGLTGTARRIQRAEKAAVLALPSQGQNARRGKPSLRRSIARATQIRVRTSGRNAGVSVGVNPQRTPQGQGSLPDLAEGDRRRWRHPVFGHDRWVTQRPMPWFYRTAAPYAPAAERDAERVLNEIADEIERR